MFGALAMLALGACTTFFDTEFEQDDAARPGACCTGNICSNESVIGCNAVGGVFTPNTTCAASPCTGPSCETYCSAFEDTCSSLEDDYSSQRACVDYCNNGAAWPTGEDGDLSGNSIACRTYHAGAASEAEGAGRQFHCRHSGITGDSICGSLCENYCFLMDQICTGENAQYADFEACTEQCQGVGNITGIPQDGLPNDTTGDSVQCRMYHVSAAFFTEAPDMHCVHASMLSTTGTCGALSTPPSRE